MKNDESIEATEVADSPSPAATQQYEGDDISALATAKARMAQRDAEYSEKFKSLTEEKPKRAPQSRAKGATARPKKVAVAKAKDEPATTQQPVEPAAKQDSEPAKQSDAATTEKPAAKTDGLTSKSATSMNNKDVAGGLRSLRGNSFIPESQATDQAEYAKAWKKL